MSARRVYAARIWMIVFFVLSQLAFAAVAPEHRARPVSVACVPGEQVGLTGDVIQIRVFENNQPVPICDESLGDRIALTVEQGYRRLLSFASRR